MGNITAYNGLNCSACDAYLATQANNEEAKERIAEKWRLEYDHPGLNAAYVTCDSCLTIDGRLGGHCQVCDIRLCGIERGQRNCGECADFETCEKLARFFGFVPAARQALLEVRHQMI